MDIIMADTFSTIIFSILLLLPILLLLCLKFFKSNSLKTDLLLPPGPKPWPILGNILHLGKSPHMSLAKYAKSYGPLMSLKLGTQLFIVGSSPAIALEIFKTHDRITTGRPVPHALPNKTPELNHLSLAWAFECNDQWKYLRTIIRNELTSAKAIESHDWVREKKVGEMVEFLSSVEGKVVNIGEVAFATFLNIVSNALVSIDFYRFGGENSGGGGGREMSGLVRSILEVMSVPNICDFYPIFAGLDMQGLKKKFNWLSARFLANWEPLIKERREGKERSDVSSHQDFLDVLLDNDFTNAQIHQLLMELIVGATDTSTTTIEWAMAELIRNPETMAKVRQELSIEINQGVPKVSHIPKLPYLQACVKETLRLHPPAPLLGGRRALASFKLMDYTIPKNAHLAVNLWAIGRDPAVWEDPLRFKPERFLNSSLDYKGNDFEFIPFGAGRRICPGLPMADKHVPLVLAALISFFSWSLPHGSDASKLDMSDKFAIATRKEQPLLLIPKVNK